MKNGLGFQAHCSGFNQKMIALLAAFRRIINQGEFCRGYRKKEHKGEGLQQGGQ